MFCRQSTVPWCLNFIPSLAWDLEIHPRTHMWFFNQLWCTRACACSSILIMHIKCPEIQLMYKKSPNEPGIIPKFSMILLFGLICLCQKIKAGEGSVCMLFRTRRWNVPSWNHEPSWEKLRFARSLFQFSQKNYHNMLVPCHGTMPSFMILRRL